MAKGGKNNNDDDLRRLSMVVDGIKESRTHTGLLVMFKKIAVSAIYIMDIQA